MTSRAPVFPSAPMSDLVDREVLYDLAESTCPPLELGELLGPEVLERLRLLGLGYGTSQGGEELRTLVAAGAGVDPADVLITVGGASALFLLALVTCRPGDHAVIATPCFPPARTVLAGVGAEVTAVPLSFDDGYRLDVDALAAAVTPATRLVSLASPQNPSGVCFAEADLRRLAGVMEAVAPDAVLLVDETYREAGYGDGAAASSVARLAPRVVTCSSVSKSHGAPGLRVGWLTATDPDLYEQLRVAKFTSLVGTSAVDELLAAEVLRNAGRFLAPRRAKLATALGLLEDWVARHADLVDFVRPDGGALCCLQLRADRFDEPAVRRFYDVLGERDARVAPGSWFGESDRVFRVGFGHLPLAVFETALDRLAEALRAGAGALA